VSKYYPILDSLTREMRNRVITEAVDYLLHNGRYVIHLVDEACTSPSNNDIIILTTTTTTRTPDMTTTERPDWSATDRQRAYLLKLIEQREIAEVAATNVQDLCERDDFTKADASELIDTFTKVPWRPKPYSAPASPLTGAGAAPTVSIDSLEVSKFAIPTTEASADLAALAGNSDLIFGEVREWNKHRFINVLKGAPGDWNRIRLAKDKAGLRTEVINILGAGQYKYTKLYGEHYTCCGCCGAALSDQISRDLQLGPECRKRFGF
jgi:hypothetical protein